MRQLAESVYARYRQALGDEDYPMPDDGYAGEYIKTIAEEIAAAHGDTLRESEDRTYFQKYAEQWFSVAQNGGRRGARGWILYSSNG